MYSGNGRVREVSKLFVECIHDAGCVSKRYSHDAGPAESYT